MHDRLSRYGILFWIPCLPTKSQTDFEHHDFYFLAISDSYETQEGSWHYHPEFYPLFHGADRGGKRYPDRLEDLAAVSLAFTANSKPFAVLLDDDLLECLEDPA
jgi:hypothetical protein